MTVINCDCRHGMRSLPENTLDAIVTDPPYGLSSPPDMAEVLRHWLNGDDYEHKSAGFMNKAWDSFVPGPATWREALRVLKPGGYALVFAGSRTQDLMSTALRLAGFEVVDCLFWMYGSGFPKSYDVAKAVDRQVAAGTRKQRAYRFTQWIRDNCVLSSSNIDALIGCNGMGRHFRDVPPTGKQPHVATREHFEALRPYFTADAPDWLEAMVDERTVESENEKRRKVIGKHEKPAHAAEWRVNYQGGELRGAADITAAYTPEAQRWEGWGTALKPCYEPIIFARKPLDGTYASNLLTHECGALNIDGCRNGERWPGNVLHDGCMPEPMDRYFYCAKASRADREAGLDGFERQSAGEATGGRKEGSAGLNSPRSGAGRTAGSKNPVPTVKPTELMRWCVRLVTPPGGLVGDPFSGSGSTGRGAALEGIGFIGWEMDEESARAANARIEHAKKEAAQ